MSESTFRWVAGAIVVGLGLLTYANSFTNDFVWDDASSILVNKHIQDPAFFFQLFREDQHPFGRGQGNFYRPLTAASFMADFLASSPATERAKTDRGIPSVSPFLFHVTNTLWHVAAALLVFALLTRLGAPRFVRAAVPCLYVAHPLHTEAITYMSGRADPLAATFLFAALWFSMYEATFNRRMLGTVLSAVCFAGGLLCKESASIFPALLFLFVLVRPIPAGEAGQPVRKKRVYMDRLIPLVPAVAMLGVYGYLRTTVLKFGSTPAPESSFGQRLIETCQALGLYLKLIFVPTGLHMERTLAGASNWTAVAGAVFLLACVMGFALGIRYRRNRISLGLGLFLLSWFPISGIIPLNAPMAEHWLYVPLAGFLWALAEAVAPWIEAAPLRRRLAVGVVWAVCAVLMGLSVMRNETWRDNETLFRDTLDKNPRSVRVQFNLAVTYEDLLKNLPAARRHYEAVLALYKDQKQTQAAKTGKEMLWDDELESHLSLGRILFGQQQYGAAAEHYAVLLGIEPDARHRDLVAEAALGVGKCAFAAGDVRKASELFKKALTLAPGLKPELERFLTGEGADQAS